MQFKYDNKSERISKFLNFDFFMRGYSGYITFNILYLAHIDHRSQLMYTNWYVFLLTIGIVSFRYKPIGLVYTYIL